MKLFVGGLSWQTGEEDLRQYFSQFGAIDNVQIMKDPFTMVRLGMIRIFIMIIFSKPCINIMVELSIRMRSGISD